MDVESIETDFQIVNCYFVNVRVSAVIGIFNGKFFNGIFKVIQYD